MVGEPKTVKLKVLKLQVNPAVCVPTDSCLGCLWGHRQRGLGTQTAGFSLV